MPIYVYECYDCKEDFKVSHSMHEDWGKCDICESANIARKPTFFTNLSKSATEKQKVGDLTKEFINDSKEDLKRQKKELDTNR